MKFTIKNEKLKISVSEMRPSTSLDALALQLQLQIIESNKTLDATARIPSPGIDQAECGTSWSLVILSWLLCSQLENKMHCDTSNKFEMSCNLLLTLSKKWLWTEFSQLASQMTLSRNLNFAIYDHWTDVTDVCYAHHVSIQQPSLCNFLQEDPPFSFVVTLLLVMTQSFMSPT